MPNYSFENKKTGEVTTVTMKIAGLDEYKKNNPDLEQLLTVPQFVDPVTIGVTRPPSDFQKYVLGKVKQVPGADKNKIEKRWQIAKEI